MNRPPPPPRPVDPARIVQATAALAARTAVLRDWAPVHIEPIPGQASSRRYWRLWAQAGAAPPSVVCMELPPDPMRPDEIAGSEPPPELPFLAVARFLERAGLPAPRVYASDLDAGIVLLEDLGDTLLERIVRDAPTDVLRTWYGRAVDLLVEFQAAAERARDDWWFFARRFDRDLLRWELDHFREYGIEVRQGARLPAPTRRELDRCCDDLADELAALPTGPVHRDFQSRNLMVRGERLHVIDFQDALTGPWVYDLAGLLRDSYVCLPAELIGEALDRWRERRLERGLWAPSRTEVRRAFHLQTVQRKLKDAGRFVYIDRVKGNPSFLPNVGRSLSYAASSLARLADYAHLADLLADIVPEMRPLLDNPGPAP